jgi:dephospho-CoA kinase
MNIGLTGGIACGKSTVSNMLVKKGAALVDADAIAREVVLPGEAGYEAILKRFGENLILPDRSLDRKALGEIIFADEQARIDLQSILHPLIREKMWRQIADFEATSPSRWVVVDVPLLYESQLQALFPKVVVVYVDRETQIERLMSRDGINRQEAEARLKAQMPIDEKKRMADYVIDNRGTMEQTREQVNDFWHQLNSLSGSHQTEENTVE